MRFFKLALVVSTSGWLAACTTSPQLPLEAALTAPLRATAAEPTQPTPAASSPLDVSTQLTEVPPGERAADLSAQPLLAGGPVREFERGGASWYGPGFHGRRTASGERYNMHAFTAAHRTLPFGTWLRVRSLINGHEVTVRVTDRGPFGRRRVIDLSRAAAAELGMLGLGVKEVVIILADEPSAKIVSSPP